MTVIFINAFLNFLDINRLYSIKHEQDCILGELIQILFDRALDDNVCNLQAQIHMIIDQNLLKFKYQYTLEDLQNFLINNNFSLYILIYLANDFIFYFCLHLLSFRLVYS